MPWTHCDEEIQDDESCPSCGITKEQWTVQFEVTRTFVVTRRPLVKVELINKEDEAVPREPIEVVFPERSGRADEELDDDGIKKVVAEQAGTCTLTFPYWAEGEVVRIPDDEGEEGGDDDEAGASESGEVRASAERCNPPAQFEVTTRRRAYRFRVVVPYLDVELLDPEETPVPGQAFELLQDDAAVVASEVGERGWSRVRGLAEGDYELRLPGLTRADWSRKPVAEGDDSSGADGGDTAGESADGSGEASA